MAQVHDNKNCPLYGTEYCSNLNMPTCQECTIGSMKADDIESAKSDLDVIAALMPRDGISDLFTTEECVCCKGEQKGKRACYAILDLGNAEPKHVKRNVVGIKVTARTGALVPVQLSCCSECRKRFRLVEYFPMVLGIGVAALLLILLSIRDIREPIAARAEALPVIIFCVGVLAAIIAGKLVRKSLVKKYSELTHLDVFEIPKLAEMKERGWFELNESKTGATRLVFSQNRIKRGLYTGEGKKQDELSEDA